LDRQPPACLLVVVVVVVVGDGRRPFAWRDMCN
jgi:hypothetical protein